MLDILGNALAFMFALGVIIFVHEGGHLVVAKLFKIRAVTFSLGFGKRLWGFKRGSPPRTPGSSRRSAGSSSATMGSRSS